ncbi:MAG: putative membrane protein YedE/YeeE [Arenicella sp.]|jgi:uncharacterized membrane protein YedE/YeeE
MRTHLIALVSGALFGIGLAVSQMVNPEKVLAFLDVFGDWDPSLLLVIGSATGFTLISFRWVLKRQQPLFADSFRLPAKTDIDSQLLTGAALFGIGWGLAGYCPGPGLAALTLGSLEPIVFVVCLLIGSSVPALFTNRNEASSEGD